MDKLGTYDVIVIGAGHAGIEAAHAAARLVPYSYISACVRLSQNAHQPKLSRVKFMMCIQVKMEKRLRR